MQKESGEHDFFRSLNHVKDVPPRLKLFTELRDAFQIWERVQFFHKNCCETLIIVFVWNFLLNDIILIPDRAVWVPGYGPRNMAKKLSGFSTRQPSQEKKKENVGVCVKENNWSIIKVKQKRKLYSTRTLSSASIHFFSLNSFPLFTPLLLITVPKIKVHLFFELRGDRRERRRRNNKGTNIS